ncbi:MAG: hypothetical protein HQL57_06395 [Magnetococcales bacterium]|nr:hypothetical protein [Magnetococcales bacterium]MBF0156799.1 hypothetical protein [Magnetococcales bacterium]
MKRIGVISLGFALLLLLLPFVGTFLTPLVAGLALWGCSRGGNAGLWAMVINLLNLTPIFSPIQGMNVAGAFQKGIYWPLAVHLLLVGIQVAGIVLFWKCRKKARLQAHSQGDD